MSVPFDYKEVLRWLGTARVRLLLSKLMQDRDGRNRGRWWEKPETQPGITRTDTR